MLVECGYNGGDICPLHGGGILPPLLDDPYDPKGGGPPTRGRIYPLLFMGRASINPRVPRGRFGVSPGLGGLEIEISKGGGYLIYEPVEVRAVSLSVQQS